jgi:hypothetical protein
MASKFNTASLRKRAPKRHGSARRAGRMRIARRFAASV